MKLQNLSTVSSTFPATLVEYEDLLTLRYRLRGRVTDGTVDCVGIVLEIYRRAGLGLPDPWTSGCQAIEFSECFEAISAPDHLFDVIRCIGRTQDGIMVVVRDGIALTSREKIGVHAVTVKALLNLPRIEYYRVRSDCLP